MALCFYGYSKKSKDGFSMFFHSATVCLVAVLICIKSFAKGDDCRNIEFREKIENMVLISHLIKSERVLKEENCQLYCYLEANCVSYNYGPAEDELYLCELSDKNHLQVPSDELEERHGFIYRPVTPNFCVTSPCASNSTCQTGYGEEGYRCLCPHGFHGDKCQLDIEECVSGDHNCSPNAICGNVPGSFLCSCKTGYTGDGVNCTAEPPIMVACVSVTKILDMDTYLYEVNADHGSWPADGFCRVIPKVEITDIESYTLTVEIMNVDGRDGENFGHPGVMYNVVDESNFDVVYFRPHNHGTCYQLGYVSNGAWFHTVSSSCPNGSPSGGVWFTVRVEVFLDKSVNIYLNNDLVTSLTAKLNTKGRGGVLVANGYQNIILFRRFDINKKV